MQRLAARLVLGQERVCSGRAGWRACGAPSPAHALPSVWCAVRQLGACVRSFVCSHAGCPCVRIHGWGLCVFAASVPACVNCRLEVCRRARLLLLVPSYGCAPHSVRSVSAVRKRLLACRTCSDCAQLCPPFHAYTPRPMIAHSHGSPVWRTPVCATHHGVSCQCGTQPAKPLTMCCASTS